MKKPAVEKVTILVIDDCASMRFTTKAFLKKIKELEFVVIEAKDGRDALQKLPPNTDTNVDLILLDWHMPRLNGVQFVKKIRQSPLKSIPIIMLSATQTKEEIIEALKTGVTDYIIKPLKRDVLTGKLMKHLKPSTPPPGQPELKDDEPGDEDVPEDRDQVKQKS